MTDDTELTNYYIFLINIKIHLT